MAVCNITVIEMKRPLRNGAAFFVDVLLDAYRRLYFHTHNESTYS